MSDLTIGGEAFRIAVDGDEASPALLLCHPLGGDHRIWDAQVPELARRFRVVRYDARGHGGSTTVGAPYSIVRLGLDALAILDALEIEKAHVLGMSMGGAVAQWLMIHAPHRVERGILANTAAKFSPAASWNERIVTVQAEGMEGLCEPTLARWFGDAFVAEHAAVVDPVRQTFLGTAPEGYAASCAALRDADLREGLRQISNPVLVVAGRHDPSVGAAETDLLAASIPDATLVTLDTYHIANLGDPAGFAKAVSVFLAAKTPARRSGGRESSPRLPVARRPAGRRTAAARGTAAPRPPVATAKRKQASAPPKAARARVSQAAPPFDKPAPRRGRPAAAAKTSAAAKSRTKEESKTATRTARKPAQSSPKRGRPITVARTIRPPKAPATRSKGLPAATGAKTARQPAVAKLGRPKPAAIKGPAAKARTSSTRAAKTAAPVKPAPRKAPAKAAAKPVLKASAKTPVKAPARASARVKAKAAAKRPLGPTGRRKA